MIVVCDGIDVIPLQFSWSPNRIRAAHPRPLNRCALCIVGQQQQQQLNIKAFVFIDGCPTELSGWCPSVSLLTRPTGFSRGLFFAARLYNETSSPFVLDSVLIPFFLPILYELKWICSRKNGGCTYFAFCTCCDILFEKCARKHTWGVVRIKRSQKGLGLMTNKGPLGPVWRHH